MLYSLYLITPQKALGCPQSLLKSLSSMLFELHVFQSVEQYKEGIVDIIPTLMEFWSTLNSTAYIHRVKEWKVRPWRRNDDDYLHFKLELQAQTEQVAISKYEHLRVALSSIGLYEVEYSTHK